MAAAGAAPKASILLSLRAREVYLFVAAENRQVPQGPCGVVFLGDMAMGAYTLLLYKSQENHLARVPFTDRFKLETTVRHRSIPTASALPAPVCAALLAQARELTWMLAAAPGQRAVRHAPRWTVQLWRVYIRRNPDVDERPGRAVLPVLGPCLEERDETGCAGGGP